MNKTRDMMESLLLNIPKNWRINLFAVDDGSTDGTAEMLTSYGSMTKIIRGPGDWYWAKSMSIAEKSIDIPNDYILWLNDDVKVLSHALSKFETFRKKYPNSILVGQLCNSQTSHTTYGGLKRDRFRPLRFSLEEAQKEEKFVDTFNGNMVLVPSVVNQSLGGIEGKFAHAYADLDFGLRANKAGVKIVLIPGYLGICDKSDFSLVNLGLIHRIMKIHEPKGQPFKSQLLFLRRHGRRFWPVFLLSPYIRAILNQTQF